MNQSSHPVINRTIRWSIFFLCMVLWSGCQHSTGSITHLRTSDGTAWEIVTDTIRLDIKSFTKPNARVEVVSYQQLHERYYCLLNECGISDFADNRYLFLTLNKNGQLLAKVNCTPQFTNLGYFKLLIQNDSIIVVQDNGDVPLYYDQQLQKWMPAKGIHVRGIEDADFIVHQYDRGEWGTRTIFQDKKTRKNYFSLCAGKTICKWGNSYVCTGNYYVSAIDNPAKLQFCSNTDSIIHNFDLWSKYSHQGERILFEQSIKFNPNRPPVKQEDTEMKTSFTANNLLYHLFTINDTNYIGTIHGEQLKRMIRLQPGITFYDDAIVFNDITNNIQHLQFRKDENTFGYMELHGNRMQFHYLIHNQDSLRYLGKDGFASVFRGLHTLKTVSMEKLNQLEQQTNGTYLQIDHLNINHNAYYDPKFKTLPVRTKCYTKVIDRFLTLESEYLFNTKKNKLEAAFLEWRDTRDYRVPKIYTNLFEFPDMCKEILAKSDEIEKIISRELLMSPVRVSEPKGYYTLIWKTKNNLKITLYSSSDCKNNNSLSVLIEMPEK